MTGTRTGARGIGSGWLAVLTLGLVWGAPGKAAAETADQKGLAIAVEADRRDAGWIDAVAKVEMILGNRQGQESLRRLDISWLEQPAADQGDKVLIIFEQPRDVAGTALLSFGGVRQPDDQWLYLPAVKRVRRISSANRSGPFVGSEFAYEDLVAEEPANYRYRWLRSEACGPLRCEVVERISALPDSGYSRQEAWYDTADFRQMRIDFFDRAGAALKTLQMSDYQQFKGKYWRAFRQEMVNHQTGKTTTLRFLTYEFQTGLSEGLFSPQRLSQTR